MTRTKISNYGCAILVSMTIDYFRRKTVDYPELSGIFRKNQLTIENIQKKKKNNYPEFSGKDN